MKTLLLALSMAATLPTLAASAEEQAWWDGRWQARRTFECTGTRSELPGDEVGVVEFLSGGMTAPGGKDLRVLARGVSRPLPLKVLSAGPGDLLRVCFPLVKDETVYNVYYGNPAADQCEGFEPRRGLLMEVRTYRGGQPDNLKGMREIITKAGPLQGSDFVDRVFFGYNPFGPSPNQVAIYTGWLKCPADGEYTFATSSDDASFLLLDGKLVTAWPGWHGAVPDIRHKGVTTLTAGLHRLEYLHVNGDGDGTAVAAWQPPGADKVTVIPGEAFARVSRGRQTGYALKGRGTPPDFLVRSAGEAYMENETYLVRAEFAGQYGSTKPPPGATLSWDFGDGQTGSGANVEHVYLLPGLYRVRLTIEVSGARLECANTVLVDRDMRRAIAGKSERLQDYAARLGGCDLTKVSPAGLLSLAAAYDELGQTGAQLSVARAILARPADQFSDQDCFRQLVIAAHALRGGERKPDDRAEALRLLDAAEKRFQDSRNDSLRAQVIRERGDVYYYYLHDLEKAYNEYDKVVSRFRGLEDNIVRITKIRLGDIHRERGNYAEAERRYREAEALKLYRQNPQNEDVRRGALAHTAESYLRARELDECERALNIWEWEYPIERLRGYSTVVRSRLEALRNNQEEVVKQAEALLKVNPKSDYAGQLLLMEAQAHEALGRRETAATCLERILKEYPECEQVGDAGEMLKKAGAAQPKGPPSGRK